MFSNSWSIFLFCFFSCSYNHEIYVLVFCIFCFIIVVSSNLVAVAISIIASWINWKTTGEMLGIIVINLCNIRKMGCVSVSIVSIAHTFCFCSSGGRSLNVVSVMMILKIKLLKVYPPITKNANFTRHKIYCHREK